MILLKQIIKKILSSIILIALAIFAILSLSAWSTDFLTPSVKNFIEKKAKEHHITLNVKEVSATGYALLENIDIPLKNEASIHIDKAKFYPPIFMFKGSIDANDVTFHYKDHAIFIAHIIASDISKSLQSQSSIISTDAKDYNIGSLQIPTLNLSNKDKNINININDIELKDASYNGIKSSKISNLLLQTTKDQKSKKLKLSNLSIDDINLTNIKNLLKGIEANNSDTISNLSSNQNNNNELLKNLTAQNLNLKFCEEDLCKYNIDVSNLLLSSIAIKPFKEPFKDLLTSLIENKDNKTILLQNIKQIAKNIQNINLTIQGINGSILNNNFLAKDLRLNASAWQQLLPYQLLVSFSNIIITNFDANNHKLDKLNIIKNLPVSVNLAYSYDPQTHDFAIKDFLFDVKNFASANISLILDDFDNKIFDLNPDIDQIYQVAIKYLNISYKDFGIWNKFVNWVSEKQNLEKSDVELLVHTVLQKSPALLLKNNSIGDIIGNKLNDIANNPQQFNLSLSAKDNYKIKLSDFFNMNEADFEQFLQKINLQSSSIPLS